MKLVEFVKDTIVDGKYYVKGSVASIRDVAAQREIDAGVAVDAVNDPAAPSFVLVEFLHPKIVDGVKFQPGDVVRLTLTPDIKLLLEHKIVQLVRRGPGRPRKVTEDVKSTTA